MVNLWACVQYYPINLTSRRIILVARNFKREIQRNSFKMAESEETEEVVDHYAVLNVRREVEMNWAKLLMRQVFYLTTGVLWIEFQANESEIKAAYRRMCVLYHPDKHTDPAKKKVSLLNNSSVRQNFVL